MPRKDLDALLGDPLELVIGGETYIVRDIPVRVVMELNRALEEGKEPDTWAVLEGIFIPLGVSREKLESWGTAQAIIAVRAIWDHFTELLGRAAPGAPTPREEAPPSDGSMPSPDSSDTSAPATG